LRLDQSGQQNHSTSLYMLDKNKPINNERLIQIDLNQSLENAEEDET